MSIPDPPDLPSAADHESHDGGSHDAAAMLDLVRTQQERVTKQLAAEVPLILLAWGIAWFVGFGLLWLIDGARPAVAVPLPVAVIAFIVLMVGALVATKKSPYRLSPDGRLTRRALETEALSNGLVLADTMLDELSKCLK